MTEAVTRHAGTETRHTKSADRTACALGVLLLAPFSAPTTPNLCRSKIPTLLSLVFGQKCSLDFKDQLGFATSHTRKGKPIKWNFPAIVPNEKNRSSVRI
jgi:hypothetical protein